MNRRSDRPEPPRRPQPSSYLELPADALLRQCELDTFRGSGPGGQKRNKTDSAVRLRHRPSGLAAEARESRSQHQNRRRALARLRWRMALELRSPLALDDYHPPKPLADWAAAGGRPTTSRRADAYPVGIQQLLDLFGACGGSVADTARRLELSTAATSRLLTGDPSVLAAVNAMRARRGLRPLRRHRR